ncbi:uracil-DNA glycosylase [Marasmius fiardii PR-910]|nr:uracil-DNA glycosylase [Marasmius fiardii PR-910]
MANEEKPVFFEDFESQGSLAPSPVASQESTVSRATVVESQSDGDTSIKATTTATKKRQMTLTDMFGSQGNSKRTKLSPQAATSTKAIDSRTIVSVATRRPNGLPKLNSIPFSLKGFQDSLNEEERNLLNLESQLLGKSWFKLLQDEIRKPYFISLKRFLWEKGVKGPEDSAPSLKIFPPARNIYTWSDTPLGKVRVVLIGQDPYHSRGQAHGLCFSVPSGVRVPPSLNNIYAELKAEYPDFNPPKHGNLSSWAANGVLMLNACLTVEEGKPGSHANKGWETFTSEIVQIVDKYGGANLPGPSGSASIGTGRGVVFLAWGAFAEKRVAGLNKKKHLVLKSAHPSPFSAHKGFLGNGHFRKANEWLEAKYGPDGKVDWCHLEVAK